MERRIIMTSGGIEYQIEFMFEDMSSINYAWPESMADVNLKDIRLLAKGWKWAFSESNGMYLLHVKTKRTATLAQYNAYLAGTPLFTQWGWIAAAVVFVGGLGWVLAQ